MGPDKQPSGLVTPDGEPLAAPVLPTDKADIEEYGFQATTNQDGKKVYLRPLVVLDEEAAKDLTHEDVLMLLEVKSLNVLQRVVGRRADLELMKRHVAATNPNGGNGGKPQ